MKKLFISVILIGFIISTKTLNVGDKKSVKETKQSTSRSKFPKKFLFGAASAAYQIEGAWDKDGKGLSIWDKFTHDFPNKIADQRNGDFAAESYKLYKDDVKALVEMKANVYRFSISWPRILPTGDISSFNQLGVDYYHRLIDELIKNNIEPMVTMYHWDLPQNLQELGGWTNPLIADYFEQYANVLFEQYGSKIHYWITLNEPAMYCDFGYAKAEWAPGLIGEGVNEYLCGHFSIISHAKAYHLYKNKYFDRFKGKVGIALNAGFHFPKNVSDPNDVEAAERKLEFDFGWYANAIYTSTGGYPKVMIDVIEKNSKIEGRPWSRLPKFNDEMIEYVKGTSDFFGLNYYTSRIIENSPKPLEPIPSKTRDQNVIETTYFNWEKANSEWLYSVPNGLFNLLIKIKEKYNNPEIIITENGWSDVGELNDIGRVNYMKVHLKAVLKAINEKNCNIIGYTAWSIVDNFEWQMGYTEKFGLYRVDIDDPKKIRIPKKSVEYFREIIETREIP